MNRRPFRQSVTHRVCHNDIMRHWCVSVLLPACLTLVSVGRVPANEVEPAVAPPDSSLRVGEIRLDLRDIFSAEEVAAATGPNRLLRRTMNALHARTRSWVVRQELLFEPGEPLNADRLQESARNLRALGILNRVEVVPQDTARDGRVDILVRAQETWTLSTGINFSLAANNDLRWNLAVTEKNFLGYGTVVQGVIGDDLDARYGRIYLRQNRVLRSPWTLELNYDDRTDGYTRWLGLSLPFRANNQTWSFSVRAMDRQFRPRWYLSNAGPAGLDPARWQRLYALVPCADWLVRSEVLRRVSAANEGRIWRLGAGVQIYDLSYDLGRGLFALSDGRVADLSFLSAPGQPLARDAGTLVWPHLIAASQGRRWAVTRFLLRYGNQEDIPLDPAWELRCGPAGPAVGSTAGYGERWLLTLGYSNWDQTGESFWVQRAAATACLGGDRDRYHQVELLLGHYLRSGRGERPLTIKTFLEAGHGEGLRGDQAVSLGLDRGLRTLDVDGMAGDRLLRWSTETGRALPFVIADILQTGWGVFYNGGLARWAGEERALATARHEVGAGLRLGATRSGNNEIIRIDLSYDLGGEAGLVLTTIARGFF